MLKLGATALALCLTPCFAAEITVGAFFIGFDNPILGQNSLSVYNATGPVFGCDASSGLEACNDLSFLNSSIEVDYQEGGVDKNAVIILGTVAPGFVDFSAVPGLRLNGDWLITILTFRGTLDTSQVTDTQGAVRTVRTNVLGSIVRPDPNDPATQQVLLNVEDITGVNPIPEPGSMLLAAGALLAGLALRSRR